MIVFVVLNEMKSTKDDKIGIFRVNLELRMIKQETSDKLRGTWELRRSWLRDRSNSLLLPN